MVTNARPASSRRRSRRSRGSRSRTRSALRATCSSPSRSPTRCSSARPRRRRGPRCCSTCCSRWRRSRSSRRCSARCSTAPAAAGGCCSRRRWAPGRCCACSWRHGSTAFALYPLAFGALVLSKAQNVTKSALVPGVVKNKDELVLANSRLTLISLLGGVAAGPVAAVVLKLGHAPWVLRVGSVIFVFGLLRVARSPARGQRRARRDRRADATRCTGGASSPPGAPWRCMRGVVGFFTFFAAFVLKSNARTRVDVRR